MSNASNSIADPCNDEYYFKLGETASYVVNYVCTPIYFVLGLFGNIVFLRVLYARSKTDGVYLYQVFVAVGELLYVIARTVRVITNDWPSPSYRPNSPRPAWWWSCYTCVWYNAHFSNPVPNFIRTCIQLLNIFMLIDRWKSMRNSLGYKPPTNKSYMLILFTCLSLSIGINFSDIFAERMMPILNGSSIYTIDFEYSKMPTVVYALYVRNSLIGAVLFVGYALTAIIPFVFRQHLEKNKQLFTSEQERTNRRRLRTLMAVAMCETISETVCQTLSIGRNIYTSLPMECKSSRKQAILALCTLGTQVSSACNFYVMIVISKGFRRDVVKMFRRGNQVVPSVNAGP